MDKQLVLIHTDNYKNWVLDINHPTQGRRFVNARNLLLNESTHWGVTATESVPTQPATPAQLTRVHAEEYVHEVLERHTCYEWSGRRPDLAELAALMCGGTLQAAQLLHEGIARTVVHFPGAKHHAMRDRSSGFCVFNDFALAAHLLTELGHRVAILDIDAHRGDGTEALTADNSDVLTFSIHDESIFPWSPGHDAPDLRVFNRPLPAGSRGQSMLAEVRQFVALARDFQPTVVLIAAGADGHSTDPLSTLRYSEGDFILAARTLRRAFPMMPMLVGGAGGYQPDRATPRMWVKFALSLAGGTPPRRRATPQQPQRQWFSLEGLDLDDPDVLNRIVDEIWANFTTTEGESWEKR